jgi:plastocyanin
MRKIALLITALVLALGLAACGGGDDSTGASATTPPAQAGAAESTPGAGEETSEAEVEAAVPTIVVKNGEPVGGIAQIEVNAGEEVRFKVKGDESEEIHLHGYDLMEDIPAGGGTVEFDFPAEIEGIFEAELEGQGVQILELTVNP